LGIGTVTNRCGSRVGNATFIYWTYCWKWNVVEKHMSDSFWRENNWNLFLEAEATESSQIIIVIGATYNKW